VTLKGGAILKPKVQVQAKGANLLLPTPMSETRFFAQDPALLVQLYASNPANCWSSYFEAANTKRNDGQRFKATTP
jgi:hypothetical protein